MADYTLEDTIYKRFTVRAFATGIPTTLAGTPVVSAYEDDSDTQITAGITLGVDHDSVSGLNLLTIAATAANGYEAGKSYDLVITTGTVDGVSVVGEVVWHFTLSAEAAAVRLPAALVGGRIDATVDATGFEQGAIDNIWDEPLTGASHNIATSAGKRLRQVEESFVLASGTIAVVTDGHTFTLDGGAVATLDYYIGARLAIIEGTGAGQSRIITGYSAAKVVTLDSDFVTNPDTLSLYEVDAADVHVAVSDADLAGGFVAVYTDTTTITLDAGAVATADYYKGEIIVFTHGTGAGQSREITGYTAGRVVAMSPALAIALDTTTTWHIQAAVSIPEIAVAVNAEVVDVLTVDTQTLPGQEAPTATPTIKEALIYLYKAWRNLKDNDGNTTQLYADDGTTVDQTQSTSESGGTVTKTKWGSGP